jgi:flagella basal body P-ring formation protein FlgA
MKQRTETGLPHAMLARIVLLCGVACATAPAATAQDAIQPLGDITQLAEQHARHALAGQDYADLAVSAGGLDTRLRLKQCELPLESFDTATVPRGGRTTVGVRCTGASPWTLYVPVTVAAQVAVVRLKGPLPRGTLLTEAHIATGRAPLAGLPQNHLSDPGQVLGRELQRAIGTDTIATVNMLLTRALVSKGQEVIILAQGSNVEVRMAGTALQNGQQGERITVKNSNSGRTVEGIVLSADTVQVQL